MVAPSQPQHQEEVLLVHLYRMWEELLKTNQLWESQMTFPTLAHKRRW